MELVRISSLERCYLLKSKRVFLDSSLFSGKLSMFSFQTPSTCNETLSICCAIHVICHMAGSKERQGGQNRQRWDLPRAGRLEHVRKLRNIQLRINQVTFPYIDLMIELTKSLLCTKRLTPPVPPSAMGDTQGNPGPFTSFSLNLGTLLMHEECTFFTASLYNTGARREFCGGFIDFSVIKKTCESSRC